MLYLIHVFVEPLSWHAKALLKDPMQMMAMQSKVAVNRIRIHAGGDGSTPLPARGSISQQAGPNATLHMRSHQPQQQQQEQQRHQQQAQQQHAGQGYPMQGQQAHQGVPLQQLNGQSGNVLRPYWQQKAHQAGQDRSLIADRSSGGSSGSDWKNVVRDRQNPRQSQLPGNNNAVESADTTLADAFGGDNWGSSVRYTKTHR